MPPGDVARIMVAGETPLNRPTIQPNALQASIATTVTATEDTTIRVALP